MYMVVLDIFSKIVVSLDHALVLFEEGVKRGLAEGATSQGRLQDTLNPRRSEPRVTFLN
jgi:hypothetical protein